MIYSFEVFKTNSPQVSAYFRHVTKAERTSEREVAFTFDRPNIRELPQIVGELTVVPKHWFEGVGKAGRKRNVTETSLEVPLGSGPYRIKSFQAGHGIVFERVPTTGGRMSMSGSVTTISTRSASPISATTLLSSKASRPIRRIGTPKAPQKSGYGLRFSRRARQARDQGRISDPKRRHHAGLRFQSASPQVCRPASSPGVQLGNGFREHQQGAVLRTIQAHRQLLRRDRACRIRTAAGARARNSRLAALPKSPPEVFTTPYANPVGGSPQAARSNLREATRLL